MGKLLHRGAPGGAALCGKSRRRPEQRHPVRNRIERARLGRPGYEAHFAPCYSRLLPGRPLSCAARDRNGPESRSGPHTMKKLLLSALAATVFVAGALATAHAQTAEPI